MKPRPPAFTLIELLIVLGIVAILAGVALPVLNKFALQSRDVKCKSNLRQIGAAILAFAGDHDGQCPTAGAIIPYHTTSPDTGKPGWTEQLEPYGTADRRVFVCPSSGPILPANAQYSYFMGCHAAVAGRQNVSPQDFSPLRLPLLAAPSKYILGGDIASNTMFTPDDADKDDYGHDPAFAPMTRIFHGKKPNLLFADGHAAAFPAFDRNAMTVRYNLRPDGTGYSYDDP